MCYVAGRALCGAHWKGFLRGKRLTRQEGGPPGEFWVFDVPGAIPGASGGFGSGIFHFGSICASQTAGRTARSKAPIAEKRAFRIRVHLCKEQVGFYSGLGGKAAASRRTPKKQGVRRGGRPAFSLRLKNHN